MIGEDVSVLWAYIISLLQVDSKVMCWTSGGGIIFFPGQGVSAFRAHIFPFLQVDSEVFSLDSWWRDQSTPKMDIETGKPLQVRGQLLPPLLSSFPPPLSLYSYPSQWLCATLIKFCLFAAGKYCAISNEVHFTANSCRSFAMIFLFKEKCAISDPVPSYSKCVFQVLEYCLSCREMLLAFQRSLWWHENSCA